MKQLQVIGTQNSLTDYINRPTVKVIVRNSNNKILIINDGLLPGGGVENDEDNLSALKRELLEELGIEVMNHQEIGYVTQYRNAIKRKYLVYGYTAIYKDKVTDPTPQDDREAQFSHGWYALQDALRILEASISQVRDNTAKLNDSEKESKLYNLMTTKIFLDSLTENSGFIH